MHYKNVPNVPFDDDELEWVKKANQTVTPDDVIQLAKDLIAFIEENKESQDKTQDTDDLEVADVGQPMMSNESTQDENTDENQDFEKQMCFQKRNATLLQALTVRGPSLLLYAA